MRVLIVQPTHYRSREDPTLYKTRKRTVVGLTLPYLAALTPRAWEVTLIDEQVDDVDFYTPVDLVALTVWTITSLRAYAIGEAFRELGVPVVMGGPHMRFHAEEAAEHCDAVAIGEGENLWPRILRDAAADQLREFYRADGPEDLSHLPSPCYEPLDLRRHGLVKTFSVQTSRGCPFRCDFCSERFYLGHRYRYRPTEEVVEEIRRVGARNVLFADSNFAGNVEHTMELMEGLLPLKVRWSTPLPTHLCANREFMDLAKRSGLLHANIGFESLDPATLRGMNKQNNRPDRYPEILGNLNRRGISYSLNFMFGWPSEPPDIFETTLSFLERNRVPAAYFNILTPHKGTPLYERMLAEGKIVDVAGIGRWPGVHCHILPARGSPQDLEEAVKELYRKFYRFRSMVRRVPPPVTQASIASWVVNVSQNRMVRGGLAAENFDTH